MNFNQKMIKAATDPKYRELLQVAAKLEKTPEYKASVEKRKEKRKEKGRKEMVKKLSTFFGKPPSGGKRKTRRKKRKQRGGNTPACQTREFEYEELENREGETFHVKAPEDEFMADGNYRLEDYGIDGQGGEGEGLGLVGVSGGANGDFHVDATDIANHRVRICKLDDGDEEKRQSGGRRKKRRKSRKNKRSKKRRVKKRKTRKRRKKRR